MIRSWRVAALACAAAAMQISGGSAGEIGDPSITVRDVSNVDISIGIEAGAAGSFGVKPFNQAMRDAVASREIGTADRVALRREFSFLDESDDTALSEVVAAVRSDPDQPSEPAETETAVDGWTGMLDSDEPALVPPRLRHAPRDAAGRSPSGMGSQIIP